MQDFDELNVSVAKLETALEFTLKQNEKLDQKLDLILLNIQKSSAEREADLYSLRFSIKKKIQDSIKELKEYHDADLLQIKTFANTAKWTLFPHKYPKVTLFIGTVLFINVLDTVWTHRTFVKQIIEFFIPFI